MTCDGDRTSGNADQRSLFQLSVIRLPAQQLDGFLGVGFIHEDHLVG